ncbi:MAG: 3-hydroxyisobutyrate dehydrogenase [Frankiales bacterium]|nr:3-hydroxyisobutyrate dehydrogenase [Frankiales bacterium]
MSTPVIGFVGLGAMGSRMVARLLDRGYDVVVHNRTREREAPLVARGARSAATPAALAATADIVLGCLLHDAAVEEVYCGPLGLLAGSRPDQVFVEHATFSPALARRLALDLEQRGASFVDAPVSGGPEGADAGTLTVMAGGAESAVVRAAEVVDAYAARVVRVGPVGAGLTLKLVNQQLVTCHVAAAGEAERLLRELGVDSESASEVLTTSWGDSAMLRRLFTERARTDAPPSEATIGGLREPQRLLAELIGARGLDLPITNAAMSLFARACEQQRGADDLVDLLTWAGI